MFFTCCTVCTFLSPKSKWAYVLKQHPLVSIRAPGSNPHLVSYCGTTASLFNLKTLKHCILSVYLGRSETQVGVSLPNLFPANADHLAVLQRQQVFSCLGFSVEYWHLEVSFMPYFIQESLLDHPSQL